MKISLKATSNVKCVLLLVNFFFEESVLGRSVAARSEAWVCGRSLAGNAGLNPAGDGYLSLVSVVR